MRDIFLILVILMGFFFYTFRLKETQIFTNDTARDTLKALLIWQNKELTLIGPPASLSLNTIREVYFGSLYLYIGILGLMAVNWDPIGAVLPNTVLFTLSIPLFYMFISAQTRDKYKILFATLLYTLSPITVIHSRFFWNPNLIIPFSVLFWYLIAQKAEKKRRMIIYSLSAGITAGIMFNFHYITVLPVASFLLILFFTKQRFKSLVALVGLITASLPILLFELRHNFYLIQSFLFNFTNQQLDIQTSPIYILDRWGQLFNILGAVLGLKSAEIYYPPFFNQNNIMLVVILPIIVGCAVLTFKEIKKINSLFLLPLLISLLITVYFSFDKGLLIRYLFVVYPLLIWLIASVFYLPNFKYLSLLVFIPVMYASLGILYNDAKLERSYLSLREIEQICKKIIYENPTGRYNITENIHGDARAMAFRYCLNKDGKVKPQNELSYTNLSTLYVVSPSLDKIYQEKRWEFTASAPWKLVETEKIDSVNLYKFVK